MKRPSARDAAIANAGKPRKPGRPRKYDVPVWLLVDADLDRRVRTFAELNALTLSEAWRKLAALALDHLEGITA